MKSVHPETPIWGVMEEAELDSEEIIEILTEQSQEDLKKPQYEYPKKYEYPKHPFYYDGKKVYSCTECNLEGDIEVFWKHLLAVHPQDAEKVLRYHFEQSFIKENDARGYGKNPYTPEQISRWAKEKWERLRSNLEFRSGGEDVLATWISNVSQVEQKKMLQGLRESCNYCGATRENMNVPSLQEKYWQEKILTELKATNDSLKDLQFNDLAKVAKFKGMWNLEPIQLDLRSMVHYATAHPEQLQELVASKILKGDLPLWLACLRAEHSKQELAMVQGLITVKDRLSKEALQFLQGLMPSKHVQGPKRATLERVSDT